MYRRLSRWLQHHRQERRVLIICDRPNWAYDAIAKALVKHNADRRLALDIAYVKGGNRPVQKACRGYDLYFPLGWQVLASLDSDGARNLMPFLDLERTITGIHSHHSWDGHRTMPDQDVAPPESLVAFLSKCRGVNAVSHRLTRVFQEAGLSTVAYTPNGVDTSIFRPEKPMRTDGPLRVGFSGNQKHDWRKGVTEFIKPACDLPGVALRLAMPQEGHYVPLEDMWQFYNDIDVYLCASSSEGFSLSVLEASACGRPVISTRVGGCEDLIQDGDNGYLVDRDVGAMRDRIQFILENRQEAQQMGARNRQLAEENWSWDLRANAWLTFIRSHLP